MIQANRINLILVSIATLALLVGILPSLAYAQDFSRGIALNVEVADGNIAGGDIVELASNGIIRAKTPYSQAIRGVAVDQPLIAIHEKTDKTRSIVINGEASVKVSAKNGGIKVGDYVTTSDIPGVGVRAIDAGYVIGMAQTAFTPPNSDKVNQSNATGTVVVTLNIHFHAYKTNDLGGPFVRVFQAFAQGTETPGQFAPIIRYVLGALVALVSFILAFLFFGRNVKSSIEALGRNPLARSSIQFTILLNMLFTGLVILAGLFIAFMIIRF